MGFNHCARECVRRICVKYESMKYPDFRGEVLLFVLQ